MMLARPGVAAMVKRFAQSRRDRREYWFTRRRGDAEKEKGGKAANPPRDAEG